MVRLPQLMLGALLISSFLPMSSSLAVVREDFLSNATTERAELRSAVRAELARVQAKMVKAGMKPRWPQWLVSWHDSLPDKWKPLTGKYPNCFQTALEFSDPMWSIAEGIAAWTATCEGNGTNKDSNSCKEIKLGLSEDSLGAAAWALDFPTNCLEKTCGGTPTVNGKKVPANPVNQGAVLFSSLTDFSASIMGYFTSHYSQKLHCDDKAGDTLADAFTLDWPRYWHPGFSNFIPLVKEIREIVQIGYAGPNEIMYGKVEKVLSLCEWIAGTVQTVLEAEMDRFGDKKEMGSSATLGCAAAGSHIVASVFAMFGSIFKFVACWVGEWETYQVQSVRNAAGAAPYTPPGGVAALPGAPVGNVGPPNNGPAGPMPPQPQPQPQPPPPLDLVPPNIPPFNIGPPLVNGALASSGLYPPPPPTRALPDLPVPDLIPDDDEEPNPVPPPQRAPDMVKCLYKKVSENTCMYFVEAYRKGTKHPSECYTKCCLKTDYDFPERIHNKKWCSLGEDGPPPPLEDGPWKAESFIPNGGLARVGSVEKMTSQEEIDSKATFRRQRTRTNFDENTD